MNFIIVSSSILLVLYLFFYNFNFPFWVYPITFLVELNIVIIIYYRTFFSSDKRTTQTTLSEDDQNQLKELEIARRVQTALLDVETPEIDGIKIAKRCTPAATLGGDFYTFVSKSTHSLSPKSHLPGVIEYNDKYENILGFAIGDVAGHGVSSALVMALSFGILGKIGQRITSPENVLKRANEDIRKFITNSQISHVTAIYGTIHPQTRIFTYASAGHNPPLLVKANQDFVQELYSQGAFLGMYPDEEYESHEVQLETGDRIVLFTDGIIEPMNPQKEMFGEARLKKLLLEFSNEPIDVLIDHILDEVNRFSSSSTLKDDQTIIIIEV